MTKLVVAPIVTVTLALAAVSSAGAQGPNVQIAELRCSGDPESVVLQNVGDASQNLAGWKLESDPASEVFDLSIVSGLQPGASVTIPSGPSASGVFKWSTAFIFRDNDATDYARLVNAQGTVIHQIDCKGKTVVQPPSSSPAPTPEPSPASGVPNGGGPPPPPDDLMSAGMMVLAGGSLAAAGLATIVLPRLRRRRG